MLYILFFALLTGCFLLGLAWMRIGLFNISGSSIEKYLRKATGTPFKGMVAGIGLTALLQSSSAVTVIAVGLVSARILAFPQTIGIILGTNIGTTFTLEFLSFGVSAVIAPFIAAGLMLLMFRKPKLKSFGYIFLGLGIIFASMEGFARVSAPIQHLDAVNGLLSQLNSNMALAILAGAVLTAVIQSSTATTGIAMSFIGAGVLPLEAGIAIMLGSNVGTCGTALIAGIAAGKEARLTAYAHTWLNLMGALLFLPLIPALSSVSSSLSTVPETQLAHASVIFNVVCSLCVLPFSHSFGNWIVRIHGSKR